jgi:hypothetical protein
LPIPKVNLLTTDRLNTVFIRKRKTDPVSEEDLQTNKSRVDITIEADLLMT